MRLQSSRPVRRVAELGSLGIVTSPEHSPAQKLQRATLVGKGFTSDVYAWGEGRVLKLFHSWVPAYRTQREYTVTRAIHGAGLPAPAVYELISIDGRNGIVIERVEGLSMLRHVQARPWTLFSAVRCLAELHAQIHCCVSPIELPSQREWISRGIDRSPELSPAQKQAARKALDALRDGTALCHGDFHPENVLFTARGPVVIDWETATRGDPLGDVACTSRLIQKASLPRWTPRYMHHLLKCSRALLHRSYLNRYFQLRPGSRRQIENWKAPLNAAATSWRVPATLLGLESASLNRDA
jgi:aminoglycoside phosphotransferase (APT) family kinase protein